MQQIPHHQSVQPRHQNIAQNMSPSSKYPVPSYPHPHRPPPHGVQPLDHNNKLIQHYASQRSEVTITPTPPPSSSSQAQTSSHTLPQMSIPQFAPDLAIAAATTAPAPLRDKDRHYEGSSGGVSSSSPWRGEQNYGSGGRPHNSPPTMPQPPPNFSKHYGHPQRPPSPGPLLPPSKQPHQSHPSQYRRM